MAVWHAALFLQMEKVVEAGFPLSWPGWLQSATTVTTGWSYGLAWAGVCSTLLASLATSAAAIALRAQRKLWQENTMRLKLQWNSLLAEGTAYYPQEPARARVASPAYQYSQYSQYSSREDLADTAAPDLNTFVDYKKVVGQLENSKFY